MIKIAVTGPSGSGKSTLLNLLKSKGFPVIDCDKVAHQLQEPGEECYFDLIKQFGKDILFEDGRINRKILAQKAFSNKESTVKLNSITHHFILDKVRFLCESYGNEGNSCVFIEGGALFESGLDKECKKIILLTASPDILVERICTRDSIDTDAAKLRLKSQIDHSFLISHSHLIFYNNRCQNDLKLYTDLIVSKVDEWR